MPAGSPEEIHALIAAAFNAEDLDAFIELHEQEAATIVPPDGRRVSGRDAIRAALEPIFALGPRARIEVVEKLQVDDLALTHARVHVVTTRGEERLAVSSHGTVVSRRQPDGTWRIVLDNPISPREAPMPTKTPNVLLRSEESDGVVAAIEVASAPGFKGPPLHRHAFDEAFYVLEGELTFQLRDAVFTRRSGELAFAPRDVPHTYANHSEAPARALIVCTPAGFERYFARMRAERDGVEPPEWALQDIPETIRVGPRIGQEA